MTSPHGDMAPLSAVLPTVVVPCYNEEERLNRSQFLKLAESGPLRLVFVDDGSTDGTRCVLDDMRTRCERIDVLHLPENVGKSEAVRQGLLRALSDDPPIVGYLDADLATPGSEFLRILATLQRRADLMAVFGCRIARLGTQIERKAYRHYLGRIYATAASLALGVAVYDTQCGAKVFRVGETLRAAITEPFHSAWSIDVVLFQRLLDGADDLPGIPLASFLELPLEEWHDMPGSTMRLITAATAFGDLVSVARARRSRAARRRRASATRTSPS